MSQTKRRLEREVECRCTCGGGCSFAREDHEKKCKALEYLKEVGL